MDPPPPPPSLISRVYVLSGGMFTPLLHQTERQEFFGLAQLRFNFLLFFFKDKISLQYILRR